MANVDLLRKLIREEVRAVFQEELAGILKEAIIEKRPLKTVTEEKKVEKQGIPGTLNTKPFKPVIAPNLGSSNPLSNLLAETAQSMAAEDYNTISFNSDQAQGFGYMQHIEAPVVNTVSDMVSTARASSNLDAIQINAVPDFTHLMDKLKANGSI